jgi:hypothetical protein
MKTAMRHCARLLALILVTVCVVAPAGAQQLDPASQEALVATLRMLTDPAIRGAALGASPTAATADRQLESLAGSPAVKQQLYELAGQIFEDLTRGTGGDVAKMTEALQRGQSDPASFTVLLSPRTLDRLRELSTKISDQRR